MTISMPVTAERIKNSVYISDHNNYESKQIWKGGNRMTIEEMKKELIEYGKSAGFKNYEAELDKMSDEEIKKAHANAFTENS